MEAGRHRQRRSHNQGVGAKPVCAIAIRIRLRQRGIRISPFPFPPPGESRGGAGSPHAAGRLRASGEDVVVVCKGTLGRWHASRRRLPPQEGFQSASLKPPLWIPPLQGSSMACGSKEGDFFTFLLDNVGLLMEVSSLPCRGIGGRP
jgi:hypothetical protein